MRARRPLLAVILLVAALRPAARADEPVAIAAATQAAAVVAPLPSELASQLARADALMSVGHEPAARPMLEILAAADWPCRDLALVQLAACQLAAGESALALATARRVEAEVPGTVRGADAAWLVAAALEAARSPEAAAAFREAAARFPGDPRAARAAVDEAESLEAAGLPAEAAAAWRRALEDAPADAPADAEERARRLARESGTSVAPISSATRREIAERLSRANLHERAAEAWALAGRSATGETAAKCMVERARSLYNLRRNDAARATCEDALRHHPASATAAECALLIARVASRQSDGATIERVAGKTLADPRWRSEGWRHDLGLLRAARMSEEGRRADAAKAYSRIAREATGDRAVDAEWKAAWTLLQDGHPAEAAAIMARLAQAQDLDTEVGKNVRLWRALAIERAPRDPEWPDPVDLLAELHRARPWSYCGQQARRLLAARIPREALDALDREAAEAGVVFEAPGPPALEGAAARRYALLRDAGLFAHALPEIERVVDQAKPQATTPEGRALLFELARARARAGELGRATAALSRLDSEALRLPSRRSPAAFWEVVYPRPRGELVSAAAALAGIDPAFCSAIVRAESAWRPEVRSPADARGLMQLIPPTAARLARQAGMTDFDAEQLFDPGVNVALGARYLGDLLALFDGDVAAAAASYNAGELKVSEWWAKADARGMDMAERIESIPYRETRVYVKRVLEATGWYRWLEGCDAPQRTETADAR